MKPSMLVRPAAIVTVALYSAILPTGLAEELQSPGNVVYANDFGADIGDEWSKTDSSVTPIGERRFLGDFGPEKVTLSLMDLPEHQYVRVSFDLFLMQSWDGSSRRWGPDIWELSVADGKRLIYATFTNCGFFSDNNVQSFPDDHPVKTHKGWTGASEKQSLGYIWFHSRNDGKGYVTDGVYRINVIFPHTAASLKLNFTSHCKDAKDDQSWGLDNVNVETLTAATRLSIEDLNQCWVALSGDDPAAAFESIWRMVSSGEQAVSFLDSQLRREASKQSDEIVSLVKELDDDNFQTRERATQRLRRLGPGIEPALRKALQDAMSTESRFRINTVLKDIDAKINNPRETLRRKRAARVLEVIDSKRARVLRKLIATTESDG